MGNDPAPARPASRPDAGRHPLFERLSACMQADQRPLHARLKAVLRGDRRGRGFTLERVAQDIERSIERRAARLATLPVPTFPPDLPVSLRRDEIAAAVRAHQVVVVCGETGSGKTTQLPKICLELGRGVAGIIGHTQPRRIAARAVAARIADEMGGKLGTPGCPVGYKVRFTDQSSPDQFVKLMTDGILLAETQGDRLLEQYDTLIIDEAHERSLNIDFLLGYLRQLLPRRPDLKIIVTSATIDPHSFAAHFAGPDGTPAPVVEVSGRLYPVELRYRPVELAPGEEEDEEEPDLQQAILNAVGEVLSEPTPPDGGPSDVLVFLSGEREIRETAENLRALASATTEILPLYARLSADEQNRVFQPRKGGAGASGASRRVVLATNVAETSLTVPGIRYVVDPGYARISRYSPRTKVQRLPIEKISQASADQRKGRCGRLASGVCVRLYSEKDYAERPRFTEPEIKRTNLANVILQMASLALGSVDRFPFLEPPDPRMVRDGYDTLVELGAVTPDPEHPETHHPTDGMKLTEIGRRLARLPVDPRLGRMIIAAEEEGCLDQILIIASALSVQDPRERPMEAAQQADRAHEAFKHPDSDFMGFLKLWELHQAMSRKLSGSGLRRWCQDSFVSYIRMREWNDVHTQLRELAAELGIRGDGAPAQGGSADRPGGRGGGGQKTPGPGGRTAHGESRRRALHGMAAGAGAGTGRPNPADTEAEAAALSGAVHRALLAGLLSNIGTQVDPRNKFEFNGARGLKFYIFPGSALFKKSPKWIVSAELVKTTRLYARTVASVSPAWIERAGAHLLKRTYSDAHWNERTAQVWAYERVALFGLEIVQRRRVHYGPIDPKASRELFIHHALIEGQYWSASPFSKHNRELVERVDALQARLRRRDFVRDLQARFEFFDKRLPPTIYSGQAFEPWLRHEQRTNPRALFMSLDDLLLPGAGLSAEGLLESFPDALTIGSAELPLEYRYEPGHAEDGVTLVVPLATLGHLTPERAEWLVPGMLRDKVEALMRTLPKDLRRSMVPIPDFAEKAVRDMAFGRGSMLESLSAALGRLTGMRLEPGEFSPHELPAELRLNVRVVDSAPEPAPEAPGTLGSAPNTGQPVPAAKTSKVLASGRDLPALQVQFKAAIHASLAAEAGSPWNREGVSEWDFGDLPEQATVERGGVKFPVYPAIVDPASMPGAKQVPRPTSVSLRLIDSRDAARAMTRLGVRRLFALQTRDELKFQVANLSGIDAMLVHYGPIGDPKGLKEDLADLIAELAFLSGESEPCRTKARFEQRLESGWHRLTEAGVKAGRLVGGILAARQALALRYADFTMAYDAKVTSPEHWRGAVLDIRLQLRELLPPGFVLSTPLAWLGHVPRYLQAIERRVQKLSLGGSVSAEKDERISHEIRPLWVECLRRLRRREAEARAAPDLVEVRWWIEELRVSLFAQELGTAETVSVKRIAKRLLEIEA